MPHQETSRYYERCLRQLEQLLDMQAVCYLWPNAKWDGYETVGRRIASLAKKMQEERRHAYYT